MLEAEDRVIVALDCPHDEAIALVDALKGRARWVKVGMTLYYACGPSIVREMKERGMSVFVDLKLHDIPHQVENAARVLAEAGADLMTVHALGSSKMVAAAAKGVADAGQDAGSRTRILAVTVLTSMGDDDLALIGIDATPAAEVARLASMAVEAGADGIVCSPIEAALVRDCVGGEPLIVTPGVRPAGSAVGDQVRVATPASAIANGATMLVIGRPISAAPDPLFAFESIIDELKNAH